MSTAASIRTKSTTSTPIELRLTRAGIRWSMLSYLIAVSASGVERSQADFVSFHQPIFFGMSFVIWLVFRLGYACIALERDAEFLEGDVEVQMFDLAIYAACARTDTCLGRGGVQSVHRSTTTTSTTPSAFGFGSR